MIDNQRLRTYYASFMENMYHVEHALWFKIKTLNISKPDFVAAMTRWATDISTSTKETK